MSAMDYYSQVLLESSRILHQWDGKAFALRQRLLFVAAPQMM